MNRNANYSLQLKALLSVWAILCLLLHLQLLTTEFFRPDVYNYTQIVLQPSIRFLVGAFIIAVFIIPTYNQLKPVDLGLRIIGLVILGLASSISLTFFYKLTLALTTEPVLMHSLMADTTHEIIFGLYHNVTYFLVFLSVLFAIDYLRAKAAADENRDQLSVELAETKLSVLQNQLQPHFLFNALNGVSSIINEKKEAAQDMIADLSDLLRNSLEIDYSKNIPLHKELNILDSYLNIEKRRFEHQLIIEKSIDNNALSINTPPFLLQPLVENAIKHGFSEGTHTLIIHINALLGEDSLLLKVENNGAALNEFEGGIGLENLKQRLRNIYNDEVDFCIEQRGDWVTNEIKIPIV